MNIIKAAENTRNQIGAISSNRDSEGCTLEHAAWMLDGIIAGYIQHEKAHRWLGYAQALMVLQLEVMDLREMKSINKNA
jgi:predicted nucleic acid-binding OB-fold protein